MDRTSPRRGRVGRVLSRVRPGHRPFHGPLDRADEPGPIRAIRIRGRDLHRPVTAGVQSGLVVVTSQGSGTVVPLSSGEVGTGWPVWTSPPAARVSPRRYPKRKRPHPAFDSFSGWGRSRWSTCGCCDQAVGTRGDTPHRLGMVGGDRTRWPSRRGMAHQRGGTTTVAAARMARLASPWDGARAPGASGHAPRRLCVYAWYSLTCLAVCFVT